MNRMEILWKDFNKDCARIRYEEYSEEVVAIIINNYNITFNKKQEEINLLSYWYTKVVDNQDFECTDEISVQLDNFMNFRTVLWETISDGFNAALDRVDSLREDSNFKSYIIDQQAIVTALLEMNLFK